MMGEGRHTSQQVLRRTGQGTEFPESQTHDHIPLEQERHSKGGVGDRGG